MDPDDASDERSFERALSNAMVALYKEKFGRGPTKTRTTYDGQNLIVVVLDKTMTPAEHNMANADAHHLVRESRLYFQYATKRDFEGAVEQITGRKVCAYMSALDTRADIAIEFFYLEPDS
jgi:uncharacterized protein YbcI